MKIGHTTVERAPRRDAADAGPPPRPGPSPWVTHMLGPTMMPPRVVPAFYRRLTNRLSGGGMVVFHAMGETGGLGRTDRIVDALRPVLERARTDGDKVVLAGHSLGGLVAWALAHEYPDAVAYAEIWAAPLRGTALASTRWPVAESRFLARDSRWLAQYDRPLMGVPVRAIYTTRDTLVRPPLESCPVVGDLAENHVVTNRPLPSWAHTPNQYLHRGNVGHTRLPKHAWLQDELARHDAARPPFDRSAVPSRLRDRSASVSGRRASATDGEAMRIPDLQAAGPPIAGLL